MTTQIEALTIVASLCADGVLDKKEEAILRKALANHIPDAKNMVAQPSVSVEQRSVNEHLEPVAWRVRWPKVGGGHAWVMNDEPLMAEHGFVNEPLYTTPPTQCNCSQRQCNVKPMTRDDLWKLWCNAKAEDEYMFWLKFARAIEAAHGIYAPTELKE